MIHILFIAWWWPYPATNGSKIRIYNLLRQLARTYTVTLLAFVGPGEGTLEQIEHLRSFCEVVEVVHKPEYHAEGMRALIGYLSRYPRHLQAVYSTQMAQLVAEHGQHADVIIGSQMQTLRYLELLPRLPAILEEFEITIFQNRVDNAISQPARWRAQLTLSKLEHAVEAMQRRGVAVTVVSELERLYLERLGVKAAPMAMIPNGVDTVALRPDSSLRPEPNALVYAGSVTYEPNYDAVQYFVRDVLPLVHEQHPAAQLTVTGTTGAVDVTDLMSIPGVHFTGHLDAVAPVVQSSWASVVPLRMGGGTRLKILESMALGTPVITTSKGAEGLKVRDGDNILIANSPEEIAAAVNRVLSDVDFRYRVSAAGRQLVEDEYDWEIIGQQLTHFVDTVVHKKVMLHV